MSRVNELPKADCQVCSDDSASIAVISVNSYEEVKLSDLVNSILPDCLDVKRDCDLMIDIDGKILYERCEDMSDDESVVYTNRLNKSLSQLSLKPFSRVMIQADIGTELIGCTIHVQLLEDKSLGAPGWSASYLKRGTAKSQKPEEEKKEEHIKEPNLSKSVMEIEDDEVFEVSTAREETQAAVQVGVKRLATQNMNEEQTSTKRARVGEQV